MAGGDWRAWPVARAQERLDSEAGWPRIPPGGGAWVVGQEALPSSSYPANPPREDVRMSVVQETMEAAGPFSCPAEPLHASTWSSKKASLIPLSILLTTPRGICLMARAS